MRRTIKPNSGFVNIPYGTEVVTQNGFLMFNGNPVCAAVSQNAHDYFSQDDDGQGALRGKLVQAIQRVLSKDDTNHQKRWDKVWADPICQKYKRIEHEDYWLWNHEFFNAEIGDLKYIAGLVGAKEAR